MNFALRVIASLASVWVFGCSAPRATRTARQYLEALSRGNADQAWELLSDSAQQNMSRKTHRQRVALLTADQRKAFYKASQKVAVDAYVVRWQGNGTHLVLRRQRGHTWTVVSDIPKFYRQDTPAHALETFIAAFSAQDFDVLFRFVPSAERKTVSAGVLRDRFTSEPLQSEIKAALGALANAGSGQRLDEKKWRFEFGRHRMELIEEDGQWRIADLR